MKYFFVLKSGGKLEAVLVRATSNGPAEIIR
jgi:hypothetical protein